MPSDKDARQAEYFRNRIAKNEKSLRRWARKEGIEALRLYDKDIPEVPLALDRYGEALLLALYERPYDKDEELEAEWLELMASAAAEAFGLRRSAVFTKTRRRQKGLEQYEKLDASAAERVIREGGLSFLVNLSDYLDTGLFLDHRATRAMVRAEASGKEVLNLFCYTGSFSVYAAAGGASSVTSVDLSNTYLDWAKANFELNGLSAERHPLLRADALDFLESALAEGRKWDLIVADPPTFSNSKAACDFDVARDWIGLVGRCASLLRPQGTLFFSTNSRRLKWDQGQAEAAAPGGNWEDIGLATIPPDFRDKKIHRAWRLVLPD